MTDEFLGFILGLSLEEKSMLITAAVVIFGAGWGSARIVSDRIIKILKVQNAILRDGPKDCDRPNTKDE